MENNNNKEVEEVKEVKEEVKEDVKEIVLNDKELNENLSKISNNLNTISNKISKLKDNETDETENNNIYLTKINGKSVLVDNNNKQINDYELYRKSLEIIKQDKEAGKEVPVHPQFIDYMQQYVDNIDKGGNGVSFNKEAIFREIDLKSIKNLK